MKKNPFLLVLSFVLCLCVGTLYAQNEAEEAFLKGFPDLQVGKTIGEQECKNALKNPIKGEVIGKINYKTLLNENLPEPFVKDWIIMPLGKYKVADGVYYVMYFSAITGAKHTDTEWGYELIVNLLDFKQGKQLGRNRINVGEYVLLGPIGKKKMQDILGDAILNTKAGFTFSLNTPETATLKSNWEYSKGRPKKETYQVSWNSNGLDIRIK